MKSTGITIDGYEVFKHGGKFAALSNYRGLPLCDMRKPTKDELFDSVEEIEVTLAKINQLAAAEATKEKQR